MSRTYVRIFFLGILVVLISVALLTFSNLNNYTEEVRLIRHSNRVITAVQTVMSSVRDAETGHRGYQLTRDTTYLEPYYSSLRLLPTQIAALDSLLAFDEEQSQRVDTLENKIENQFAIISQILSNARRSSGRSFMAVESDGNSSGGGTPLPAVGLFNVSPGQGRSG